jgi:hypothetical protein
VLRSANGIGFAAPASASGGGSADHDWNVSLPRAVAGSASGGVLFESLEPIMRAAAAMRFTCSGVVPQQPPTSLTPSLYMRRA